MALTVRPINYQFKLAIEAEGEKVEVTVKQLRYQEKSKIMSLATSNESGNIRIDSGLTCFYNLKYGVKEVLGLVNPDGTPYELRFDPDGTLADECVDELLGSAVSDQLQYSALKLSETRYPDSVLHPLTGDPIEGVEVIHTDKLKVVKKKSTVKSK